MADLIIEIIEDMRADRLTEDVQAVRQDTQLDIQQVDTLDLPELMVPRQRVAADPMPHPRMVARVMPQQHMVADHTATRTNSR